MSDNFEQTSSGHDVVKEHNTTHVALYEEHGLVQFLHHQRLLVPFSSLWLRHKAIRLQALGKLINIYLLSSSRRESMKSEAILKIFSTLPEQNPVEIWSAIALSVNLEALDQYDYLLPAALQRATNFQSQPLEYISFLYLSALFIHSRQEGRLDPLSLLNITPPQERLALYNVIWPHINWFELSNNRVTECIGELLTSFEAVPRIRIELHYLHQVLVAKNTQHLTNGILTFIPQNMTEKVFILSRLWDNLISKITIPTSLREFENFVYLYGSAVVNNKQFWDALCKKLDTLLQEYTWRREYDTERILRTCKFIMNKLSLVNVSSLQFASLIRRSKGLDSRLDIELFVSHNDGCCKHNVGDVIVVNFEDTYIVGMVLSRTVKVTMSAFFESSLEETLLVQTGDYFSSVLDTSIVVNISDTIPCNPTENKRQTFF